MNARHEALAEGVARCLGQRLLRWRPVSRGYSPALRLIVSCADGTSVFVKAATDTRTAAWLRTEYGVYSQLNGDDLVHGDVRSDNLCFLGDRVVLVDWNWACRGNGMIDIAGWLPTLHLEGGPPPDTLLPAQPHLAATISGYFAARAGLPVEHASSEIRALQVAELRVALA